MAAKTRIKSSLNLLEEVANERLLPSGETFGPNQYQILCVEDNASNLTLIEEILKDEPSLVLLATKKGESGVEFARDYSPDVILLDLHLPDIDGLDVLKRLKADEKTRHIPVVVISADATPRQIKGLLAAGANNYLTKPIEVSEFLCAIRTALNLQTAVEQPVAA